MSSPDSPSTFPPKEVPPTAPTSETPPPRPHATREQLREAKEIMGIDYLGPEAITTTWDVTLTPEQIPEIPFSKAELERAKQLNQFLILRIDHTADGKPLTMKEMNKLIQPQFTAQKKGKVFCDRDKTRWYMSKRFFSDDIPNARWALVSKDTIPKSTNQTYLEQTETMVDYLTTHVFKNQPIPSPYKEAIAEFETEKVNISRFFFRG